METLEASVRQLVLDHLPHDRSDAAVTAGLHAMPPTELLIRWFNWNRRLVLAAPRQVLLSREFQANANVQQRQPEIEVLITDIEAGNDLTKYLSRGVKHGYIDPAGIKTHLRQDLDLMLSAWGLHHLHTSSIVESDGFVKRDGLIVFAAFRHDKVYLIDLMTHKDWAKEYTLQVIVDNWPDDDLIHEVKGVIGLERQINDDERLILRKKQINSFVVLNGKVYAPDAGMMTNGMNFQAVRQADRVMDAIKRFAEIYDANPDDVRRQVPSNVLWPAAPSFAVQFEPRSMGIVELKTGTYFRLL